MELNKDLIERLTRALERSEANEVGEHVKRVVAYYDVETLTGNDGTKSTCILPKLVPTYTEILRLAKVAERNAISELSRLNAYERFPIERHVFEILLEDALNAIAYIHVNDRRLLSARWKQYGSYIKFTNDKGEILSIGYKFRLYNRRCGAAEYELIVVDSAEVGKNDPLGIGMK